MKIFLIGSNGQMGTDLVEELKDYQIYPSGVNITNYKQSREEIKRISPDLVINTAAYHNTKETEKNAKKTFEINAFAVLNIAQACEEVGCPLVQISTDYVFGEGKAPFSEEDQPDPQSIYGQSKYLAELFTRNTIPAHFIVRTATLFGKAGCRAKGGGNLPKTILNSTDKELRFKNDEYTSVTYTKDLAKAIHGMFLMGEYGTYHLTNKGRVSLYHFAKKVLDLAKIKKEVIPVSRTAFDNFPKPADTSLGTVKQVKLPAWEDALSRYLYELEISKS